MLILRYDLPPGWELRLMRGHSAVNMSQISVTLHGPGPGDRGRELRAMAAASIESGDTAERVAQRLVNRALRESGIGG